MKTMKTLRSQSGFSLIELMVVVAIIGILATMSVGAVQKQIAKARQSEAKTNLSGLYTAMKSFQAEWGSFVTDLDANAFTIDGANRYAVGFAANHRDDTAANVGPAWTPKAANAFVRAATQPTNGVTPAAVTGTAMAADGSTFNARAQADIFNATDDVWNITEAKVVTNTAAGIP